MTDRDPLREHRDRVRALTKPGALLSGTSPHATVNNPAWFAPGARPLAARRRLHRRLLDQARGDRVASQRPTAIVVAGPPGAGKTRVLDRVIDGGRDRWLVVDADDFKRALLREAIADGSYEAFILPPAVRAARDAGEPFAPLELSALVHAESSLLATQLRTEAIRDRLDVVIDTVLSNADVALDIGAQLDAAGYDVRVIDVETTQEISAQRVEERWRRDMQAYVAGSDPTGLAGRWVPSEYVDALFPSQLAGTSVSEAVARRLAERCPAVSTYEVHRVPDVGSPPILDVALGRAARGAALVDRSAADAVRRAQRGTTPHGLER